MAVAFVPRLSSGSTPGDIVFVVDRSGSMEGSSIEEVRNALQLCLRSMIPGCRFNIVGFGDRFESLFPGAGATTRPAWPRRASTSRRSRGSRRDRDSSGAEVRARTARGSVAPRHIVVLTDGEVTNTDAVLSLAKSHAARARIFTFGIGAGASQHLVNGLARAGGGTAEFIFPGERIEPKVVRQFGRLLSPALTNVRIDWGAPMSRRPRHRCRRSSRAAGCSPTRWWAAAPLRLSGCRPTARPARSRWRPLSIPRARHADTPSARSLRERESGSSKRAGMAVASRIASDAAEDEPCP